MARALDWREEVQIDTYEYRERRGHFVAMQFWRSCELCSLQSKHIFQQPRAAIIQMANPTVLQSSPEASLTPLWRSAREDTVPSTPVWSPSTL